MPANSQRSQRPAKLLAGLLATGGILHFIAPKPYDSMIPKQLPGGARAWTYGSGVAEIAVATAVAVPRTRRLGGLAAALLFAAVFPGNVKMAVDAQRRGTPLPLRLVAFLRLPLQIPLVTWALKVRDRA
ncbi:DoxX family protein [Amycolatopsis samaneae]|uniref:DoxX family protein n=1 Tax=Amycolatopsis samaneae TaxID=664691 RepID=A0ABW5GKW7_9PSEU